MIIEHTPGPLQAVRQFSEKTPDGSLIIDANGNHVAALYSSQFTNFRSPAEQHVNAVLFAASPNLLALARDVCSRFDDEFKADDDGAEIGGCDAVDALAELRAHALRVIATIEAKLSETS